MPQSFWKKLRRQMLYGGLSHETYREIQPRVRRQNQRMLERALRLTLAVALVLCLASLKVPSISSLQRFYGGFFVLMLLFYGVMRWGTRENLRYTLPLWYALLTLAFAFGIVLGTGTPMIHNLPATTFCVLLFALPLLVVDAAWRMNLVIVGSTAVFCVCSHLMKTAAAASMDLVNGVTFCVISLFINTVTSAVGMQQIADRMFIERERDTDGLTRLLTKSAAQMLICSYLNHGMRGAMLMIDLDNFKQLNDTYGHENGDQALMIVGRCLRETFRHTDVLGRFGGDEFLVYMLAADREAAEKSTAEFQAAVEEQTAANIPVTCSVGIALVSDEDESYEELFVRADKALYRVKGNGKRSYCVADPPAEKAGRLSLRR